MTSAPAMASPVLLAVAAVGGVLAGVPLARAVSKRSYRLDGDPERRLLLPGWLAGVMTPFVWVALAWQLGSRSPAAALPAYLLLAWSGLAIAWADADVRRIPEQISLPTIAGLAVLLAVASATSGDWWAFARGLLCAIASALCLLLLALMFPGGIGLGDVTLTALVALPLGYLAWWLPILGVVLAWLTAFFYVLVRLLVHRHRRDRHIPFGPFLVAGALVALLAPW